MNIDIMKLINYLLNFFQKIVKFIEDQDIRFDLGLAKKDEETEDEG